MNRTDLFFHEFSLPTDGSMTEKRTRRFQFAADLLALSFIGALSFLLAIFSSKYSENTEPEQVSHDAEMISQDAEETIIPEIKLKRSRTKHFFQAGGDSFDQTEIALSNIPKLGKSKKRSSDDNRHPKKSLSLNSQSTQTKDGDLKTHHVWLIRRTRSGQVYGKYPL